MLEPLCLSLVTKLQQVYPTSRSFHFSWLKISYVYLHQWKYTELLFNVIYQVLAYSLSLLVVKEHGPSLNGKNWLAKLHLDWKSIFTIKGEQQLHDLLIWHNRVFEELLAEIVKDLQLNLLMKTTQSQDSLRFIPYHLLSMTRIICIIDMHMHYLYLQVIYS